eukprot:CCRYP_018855-RA/>CCRYP_018855-RA protein AED:0.30 eAED:0.30 QI:0/0.5/0.33/1/1/1/3/754/336
MKTTISSCSSNRWIFKSMPTWNVGAEAEDTGHILLGKNGLRKKLISSAIQQRGTHGSHENLAYVRECCTSTTTTTTTDVRGGIHHSQPTYPSKHTPNSSPIPKPPRFITPSSPGRQPSFLRAPPRIGQCFGWAAPPCIGHVLDGLDDVGGRGVREIMERVLEGFCMDILAQGVGCARDMVQTQILMTRHRPEEILGGWGGLRACRRMGGEEGFGNVNDSKEEYDGFVHSLVERKENGTKASTPYHPWDGFLMYCVPRDIKINIFWESGHWKSLHGSVVLVKANQLKVIRDDKKLLSYLTWTAQHGERWHLAVTYTNCSWKILSRLTAPSKKCKQSL